MPRKLRLPCLRIQSAGLFLETFPSDDNYGDGGGTGGRCSKEEEEEARGRSLIEVTSGES